MLMLYDASFAMTTERRRHIVRVRWILHRRRRRSPRYSVQKKYPSRYNPVHCCHHVLIYWEVLRVAKDIAQGGFDDHTVSIVSVLVISSRLHSLLRGSKMWKGGRIPERCD